MLGKVILVGQGRPTVERGEGSVGGTLRWYDNSPQEDRNVPFRTWGPVGAPARLLSGGEDDGGPQAEWHDPTR